MHIGWSEDDEAFRTELSAFLDEHAPAEAHRDREGDDVIPDWARAWQAKLFDNGWMVPGYPRELGGRDATPTQTLSYLEELGRRHLVRSVHFPGYAIVAPSLLDFGTPAQQALAPAAIRGDDVWCIGMSEPDAGSDLASLRTTAVRDGERFVVNGQKVWTSYAMAARRCFLYVRTDPDAPKHKGISVLILDMTTPGIEVRPLSQITGSREFAEVFLTDVEVPVENLVGVENDGWRITMGSLAHERGGIWVQSVAAVAQSLDDLCALARTRGLDRDAGVRRDLASAYEQVASLRALGYKGFSSFARGGSAPEHSYLKLATSELGKHLNELGMRMFGPGGAALGGEAERWSKALLVSFASTIGGGTSEIQRNIIATRVLGLPRAQR